MPGKAGRRKNWIENALPDYYFFFDTELIYDWIFICYRSGSCARWCSHSVPLDWICHPTVATAL